LEGVPSLARWHRQSRRWVRGTIFCWWWFLCFRRMLRILLMLRVWWKWRFCIRRRGILRSIFQGWFRRIRRWFGYLRVGWLWTVRLLR
jgi:hypothetical protein